jgi:hypothetical protein
MVHLEVSNDLSLKGVSTHMPPMETSRRQLVADQLERIRRFLSMVVEKEGYVESLLESGFRSVSPEAIRMWVVDHVRLLPSRVKELYFEDPLIAPYTRRALQKHWGLVEFYLGDPDNTLNKMVSTNPANAEPLSDPTIRSYVVEELRHTYGYLKKFLETR